MPANRCINSRGRTLNFGFFCTIPRKEGLYKKILNELSNQDGTVEGSASKFFRVKKTLPFFTGILQELNHVISLLRTSINSVNKSK